MSRYSPRQVVKYGAPTSQLTAQTEINMYAELAIYQAPVQQTFHYAVPADLTVTIGQLVEVSFRTGRSQGIVLALTETSPIPHVKPILEIIAAEPVVTPTQIALARWMAEQTLTPISACLWLMLPPGLSKRGDTLYTLLDPDINTDEKVVTLLKERGPLRGAQIDHALPRSRWRVALDPFIKQRIVKREAILATPDVKARTVRTVQLAISPEQVYELIGSLRSQKQIAVLNLLAEQPDQSVPLDMSVIAEQTGVDSAVIHRLVEKELVRVGEAERWRDPLAGREFVPANAPPLTPQQADSWAVIGQHIEALADPQRDEPSRTYLLYGVTGSGKTEIYLRAIEQVLAQGRQAIVLVPEIALVSQTVQRFAARFPDQVSVVHSSLTDGEQYDTWRRARSGEIGVVIGARSALFTPLPDVGLVVLDEEHDDSYKQSPPLPPPYYHARATATAMMQLNRGTVILGSATPDLNTSFRAQRGEIELLRLPDRVMVHRERLAEQSHPIAIPAERYRAVEAADAMFAPLPPVQVVDMRQELRAGNRSMFSQALRTALNEVLVLGEQAMLFLNRRGTASFILCRDCGYVAKCPRCEMPLTYHQSQAQLSCHQCGFHAPQPAQCPECQSKRIRYFGAGTASLEEAVHQEFPQARTIRWDRDTTQERGAHDVILERFVSGEANVLIGTQMIAKGLDIPRVTLVGVVLADTALGLPDYRAGERAFQLLTQVAGRAGRSWLGGRVILQTYQPDHYAVQAAAKHDYDLFYAQEIEYRRTLQYPPFKRLVRIQFHYPTALQAQREAERAAEMLKRRIVEEQLTATDLIGPAPAFFGRVNDVYHWHLLARTTEPHLLLKDLTIRPGWYVDIDPVDIL
ncbi:MAG: primosomal protein N' [Chloroflexota bacterium]